MIDIVSIKTNYNLIYLLIKYLSVPFIIARNPRILNNGQDAFL